MQLVYEAHQGSDLSIVNAAKVSFGKRSVKIGKGEINLLNFLARGYSSDEWEDLITNIIKAGQNEDRDLVSNILKMVKKNAQHWTPFTHTSITTIAEAPVPIRTQCFKHKVGFTENEESRRYITSRPKFYIPDAWREATFDKKQGSGNKIHPESDLITQEYTEFCERAISKYMQLISHKFVDLATGQFHFDVNDLRRDNPTLQLVQMGISGEQARFWLPQGVEVQWWWTGNLAAYARVHNQRSDPHAQYEVRTMATAISEIMSPLFPHAWKALTLSM